MHGGRGAKGSLNDRIISYLFRKRYKEYLKKKETYTKEERQKAIDYLKKIKEFDIENNVSMLDEEDKKLLEERFKNIKIDDIKITGSPKADKLRGIANGNEPFDIKEASELLSEFEPSKDLYDFDNVDFIDTITTSTELSKEDEYGILDVNKEIKKRDDEKTIIDEVKKFVDESKKTLSEMKFEIDFIKSEIEKQYTQEQLEELKYKYNKLYEKISKLRKQYKIMKDKYEFDGYEFLENLTLVEKVDDFKTKADLEELELMVDACKFEVEAIDAVVTVEKTSKKVGVGIVEKKDELVDRDRSFEKSKSDRYRLNNLSATIEEELSHEAEILDDIQNNLRHIENETDRVVGLTINTDRMIRSFLRIAAGIITAPLFNIFGTMLGIHLVRSGLRELRQSLLPVEVDREEYARRYEQVETQIVNARNDVERTLIMIDDSFDTIRDIKKLYKQKYEKYAAYLPDYAKLWDDMESLEKRLTECRNRVNDYQQTLEESQRRNHARVYNNNH
jgi:hypothetical protein